LLEQDIVAVVIETEPPVHSGGFASGVVGALRMGSSIA
jgi:hypothetical protein